MSIEATGDEKTLDQILKQLNKLVDVVHAKDNTTEEVIAREFALIKVSCTPEVRSEVLQVAHAFDSETVDLSEDTITLQIAGETQKIDSIHSVFNKYGVLEMVRSGKILIARGSHSTS
jgi:acetolactate synthase-1/3 small subunit